MRGWWYEKGVPLLCCAPAFLIIGGALGKNIANSTPEAEAFADDLAAGLVEQFDGDGTVDICMALDAHPTVEGVEDLLDGLRADGQSLFEAGTAVADSVLNVCVIHTPLLEAFIQRHPAAPGAVA